MDLSVIIPCYNEEESLHELYKRVLATCKKADVKTYEIILINDGSDDKTLSIMKEMSAKDKKLVIVDLSRNHGHQIALSAGLSQATGNHVFILDADLQDPPELLHPMLERARAGIDVVYGKRAVRKGETWFKLFASKAFYKTLSYLSDIKIPENVGDFRLISKRVHEQLQAMPEQHRFIRGMISWIGYEQEAFLYERDARFAGVTKYSFTKLMQFSIDAISSFSIRPLRISLVFALLGALLAMLLGSYAIYSYIFKDTISGWTSLATIITFFSSLQLICIGVIGEYIGRTYIQTKERPLYIIRQIYKTSGKK
ncbi:MAG: glycosyltransferase family 2 protein [Alphaproteobacteria bacterium]|nr:glycosyltransferase family 2 protein [Alphaproteobacteria bacterium]